jgi:hypothetical protein
LFPQKFLSIQFLLLLEFTAYKKKYYFILLLFKIYQYHQKQKKTEKREKQEKKIVQKDVYWILQQKTKQEKIRSNQLGISSNLILQLLGS